MIKIAIVVMVRGLGVCVYVYQMGGVLSISKMQVDRMGETRASRCVQHLVVVRVC